MTSSTRPVGSYDPAATTGGGLAGEIARLEQQAELTWAQEWDVLARLGVPDATPVVDIGCGSGALLSRLRQALPDALLLGLDADRDLIGYAATTDVPVLMARAEKIPMRSASVGTVILRYVTQHLHDPRVVLDECRRVLRPGGCLAVIEVDADLWGVAEPTYPALATIHARIARAQARAGGDRLIGRRLTRLLRAAGFRDVVIRPFAVTSDDRGVEAFAMHLGPDRLIPMVESGVLSLADLALATTCWNRFRRDPAAWLMLLGFVVGGRSPTD